MSNCGIDGSMLYTGTTYSLHYVFLMTIDTA